MKSKRIQRLFSGGMFAPRGVVILAVVGVAACSDDDAGGEPHDAGGSADGHTPHWTYEGNEGPPYWGDLSPDYALCKNGDKQSPIDIPSSVLAAPLNGVTLAYAAAPGAILDNGHTVQINIAAGTNKITEGGKDYPLVQFHFHKHSEHTVEGKAQPLEMHLVHTASDGSYMVLGVFLKSGAANAALDEVFTKMSSATDTPLPLGHDINPTALLPTVKDGWSYDGSLTTPPCTEGVKWRVYGMPLEASVEQISQFTHDPSYRPSQPPLPVSGGN